MSLITVHSPPLSSSLMNRDRKEHDRILEGWTHFLCLWNAEECVLSLCSDFLHSVTHSFIHLQKIGFGSAEKKTFSHMSAKANFLLINSIRRYIWDPKKKQKTFELVANELKFMHGKKVPQDFKSVFRTVNYKSDLKRSVLCNLK